MAEAQTYNGWTNYETWNVALWVDNEESSYRYWREQAQDCLNQAKATESWTRKENAVFALADRLKGEFEERKDEFLENAGKSCSVWADLLGAALSEANWLEIAEAWLADMEPSDDPDEDD